MTLTARIAAAMHEHSTMGGTDVKTADQWMTVQVGEQIEADASGLVLKGGKFYENVAGKFVDMPTATFRIVGHMTLERVE
jgi:hypothetical protein